MESVPGWVVVAGLSLLVLLLLTVAGLTVALVQVRRRAVHADQVAAADAAALRAQVDAIERRLSTPAPRPAEHEYVVTMLGHDDAGETDDSRAPAPTATVSGPLFADLVLRESVVQAASVAAGLRRALSPENRNRIRFEMRREVKRARKQRRADLRQAKRDLDARRRAGTGRSSEAEAA